jgi:hypothetical protein
MSMGEKNYAAGDRVGRYYSESPTAENIGWRDLGPFYEEREIASTLVQVLQGAEELFRANGIKGVYLDSYKERAIEQFLCARKFCAARWQDAGADGRRSF